jgi:hypothetical protein
MKIVAFLRAWRAWCTWERLLGGNQCLAFGAIEKSPREGLELLAAAVEGISWKVVD